MSYFMQPDNRRKRYLAVILEFLALLMLWLLLSGQFDLKHISLGVLSCGIVTALTNDLLYSGRSGLHKVSDFFPLSCFWRMLVYTPWLLLAIVKANIGVVKVVLSPKMPLDPVFLRFDCHYKRDISFISLANSITLTPGTITVMLDDGRYVVHALDFGMAGDLETALMQNKVGKMFAEDPLKPPAIKKAHSIEELE